MGTHLTINQAIAASLRAVPPYVGHSLLHISYKTNKMKPQCDEGDIKDVLGNP